MACLKWTDIVCLRRHDHNGQRQQRSTPEERETHETVLPPLADKLKEDNGLRLSCETFSQSIEKVLETHKTRNKLNLDTLTDVHIFPTTWELANFSYLVYNEYKRNESEEEYERRLKLPYGWKLLTTAINSNIANSYFGVAYWHPERLQVVIAHRGTQPTTLGLHWFEWKGVIYNNFVPHMNSASTFADKIVKALADLEEQFGFNFELFFTGYSMGGWLAQITTFTTSYLKITDHNFIKHTSNKKQYHAHTVVFDSPGCKEMLLKIEDKFDVRLEGHSIVISSLDITSYLMAPNRINTHNTHLGTVYRLFIPELPNPGEKYKEKVIMKKILEELDSGKSGCKNDGQLKLQTVVDWPRSDGLLISKEFKLFFEWAEHFKNCYPETTDALFKQEAHQGYYPIRYQTKIFEPNKISLNVFTTTEKQFLENYQWLRQLNLLDFYDIFGVKRTKEEVKTQTNENLANFIIENDTIQSSSAEALQKIIPYIKHLVRFCSVGKHEKKSLTEVAASKKLYYKITTQYIADLEKEVLDFTGNLVNFEEFFESSYQIWHLKMLMGDAWVGMKLIYKTFQNCRKKLHDTKKYTALPLKRLLEIEELLRFKLILSTNDDPQLLMIESNEESFLESRATENFFISLFPALQRNPCLKIIIVTQHIQQFSDFFQLNAAKILGHNKYLTTDISSLSWSDLTSTSQINLLKKPVIFQGECVRLNVIIPDDQHDFLEKISPLTLIQKEPLIIGNKISTSTGYEIFLYIRRFFERQVAIKTDVKMDDENGIFQDLLAFTEKEFQDICQNNPGKNVHYLSSNNLFWEKSRGSLSALRPYVDKNKNQEKTENDLIQNPNDRIIIISGPPGIGKTTLLDHLSKLIKEKWKHFWVVRLNLNDYTAQFKEKSERFFKNESMATLTQFISTDLLGVKSTLEKDIFHLLLQKTGKFCIFFDGFDEISPDHTEKIIELVKRLEDSAVYNMFITTRPHMRELLERELQQFSYTLLPFSGENQTKLLTGIWCKELQLLSSDSQRKIERLDIYSQSVINQVLKSINDDEERLTGNPLQIRMLADIFRLQAQELCDNEDFVPELPQNFSLLELYNNFVWMKIEIFARQKVILPVGNPGAERILEREIVRLKEEHQIFSLKVLFNDEQLNLLEPPSDAGEIDTEELARIGIVQKVSHNAEFIHRTFAEYFAADILMSLLIHISKPLKVKSEFLWKVILLEQDFETVRTFLNFHLEQLPLKSNAKTLHGDLLSELWSENELYSQKSDTALHIAYRSDLTHIITFILSSLENSIETLKNLLFFKNGAGEIPLHCVSNYNNPNIIIELLNYIENIFDVETLNKIVFEKNFEGKNILHLTMQKYGFESIKALWDHLNSILDIKILKKVIFEKDKKGNSPLTSALWSYGCNPDLWNYFKSLFDVETVREIVFEKDTQGRNAIHWAIGERVNDTGMILTGIMDTIKDTFDIETVLYIIFELDNKGNNPLHTAMSAHRTSATAIALLDYIKTQLGIHSVERMILGKNAEKMTPLHLALSKLHRGSHLLWTYIKDNLNVESLKEIIFHKNITGNTILSLSVANNYILIAKDIIQLVKGVFHDEILWEIVTANNVEGNNFCHLGLLKNNPDLILLVLDVLKFIKDRLGFIKMHKVFLKKNNEGNTILHLSMNCHNEVPLLELLKYNLADELGIKTQKKIIFAKTKTGSNALHLAIQNKKFTSGIELLEFVKNQFGIQYVKQMMTEKDDNGMTSFLYVLSCDEAAVLLNYMKNNVNAETINEITYQKDEDGINLLHLAMEKQQLWEHIKNTFDASSVKRMAIETDRFGRNPLHWAMWADNFTLVKELLDYLKDNFDVGTVWKIITEKDFNGKNPLKHSCITNRAKKSILGILVYISNNFPKEYLTELVAKDDIFHKCLTWEKLDYVMAIWSFIKTNIDTEAVRIMLLISDDIYGNPVHYALANDKLNLAMEIIDYIIDKFGINFAKQFILKKNYQGFTILRTASSHGKNKSNSVMEFWNYLKARFDSETIGALILVKDNQETNILLPSLWYRSRAAFINELLNFIKNNFDAIAMRDFCFEKNEDEMSVITLAIKLNNTVLVTDVLDYVKNKYETKTVKALYFEETNSERNLLYLYVKNGILSSILELLNYMGDGLKYELKEIYLGVDQNGKNLLHWAMDRDFILVEGLLDVIKCQFDDAIVLEMIFQKDCKGNYPIHMAKNSKDAIDLLQYIGTNFGFESVKKMITVKHSTGNLLSQFLVLRDGLQSVKDIFTFIKSNLGIGTLIEMLVDKTSGDGSNMLHLAVRLEGPKTGRENMYLHINHRKHQGWKATKGFLNFAKHIFGLECLRNMVIEKTNSGSNILHIATQNKFKLEGLFYFILQNFDKSTLEMMLFDKDNKGSTPFHLAVNTKLGIGLIALIKKEFDLETVKKIFQETDGYGRSFIKNHNK